MIARLIRTVLSLIFSSASGSSSKTSSMEGFSRTISDLLISGVGRASIVVHIPAT